MPLTVVHRYVSLVITVSIVKNLFVTITFVEAMETVSSPSMEQLIVIAKRALGDFTARLTNAAVMMSMATVRMGTVRTVSVFVMILMLEQPVSTPVLVMVKSIVQVNAFVNMDLLGHSANSKIVTISLEIMSKRSACMAEPAMIQIRMIGEMASTLLSAIVLRFIAAKGVKNTSVLIRPTVLMMEFVLKTLDATVRTASQEINAR